MPEYAHATSDTLVEVLSARAAESPDRVAFSYFPHAEHGHDEVGYRRLWELVTAVAARLAGVGAAGDRVLVLSGLGAHFVAGLLGCQLAGRIPVPVVRPRGNSEFAAVAAIAEDCAATAVLAPRAALDRVRSGSGAFPALARLRWLAGDEVTAPRTIPRASEQEVAFLQYTSGSTGTPKGVVVRHSNLMHNLATIHDVFGPKPDDRGVVWLPPHHDMGLIGGILQTLYSGYQTVLMSPMTFLRDPLAWLREISDRRASFGGGPSFAYDHCVRTVSPADAAQLDLSHWKGAWVGAEPINPRVLENFARHFAVSGFEATSFLPCYGLAESTLMVTAAPLGAGIRLARSPEGHDVVGCGTPQGGRVVIADPHTGEHREPGTVGEVWVAGPSVAAGYWGRDSAAFQSRSPGEDTTFLRTGDLGFQQDGQLYVTGRLKDLIIVRGRNVAPQDVEWSIERNHPQLRRGGCAAVPVRVGGEERLAVIQEAAPGAAHDDLAASIRQVVSREHALDVHRIMFVRPGGIPRTTSGKPRRAQARALLLDETPPLARE